MKIGSYLLSWILFISLLNSEPTKLRKERVILLHGLARSASSMSGLAEFLNKNGYEVHNIDYPSRTAVMDSLVLILKDSLNHCCLDTLVPTHFVTHSMGGILVREYFHKFSLPKAGRVVMLGPPNAGSEVPGFVSKIPGVTSLQGPNLIALDTAAKARPKSLGPILLETGVIAGDRSINWINSLLIPGPDDGKVSVKSAFSLNLKDTITVHKTHPMMMKSKDLWKQVLHFLKKGKFKKS